MKNTMLCAVLSTLILPVSVQALELGEIRVASALGQPFFAEIELLDMRNISASSIKAELKNPNQLQRADLLALHVGKNVYGRWVVQIHSSQPIFEPYLQLPIDLTWPQGQIHKSYTVLLDPPGYKLETSVDTTKNVKNPNGVHENVWQIAQHYKTKEVILPQIVLAIVGVNPHAFTDGNLNGLNTRHKLSIPSLGEMINVPADLALVEVMAHDQAWNEKTPINHVLAPPYTCRKKVAASNVRGELNVEVTTALVEPLRESNAMLLQRVHWLQSENNKLHQQLARQDKR